MVVQDITVQLEMPRRTIYSTQCLWRTERGPHLQPRRARHACRGGGGVDSVETAPQLLPVEVGQVKSGAMPFQSHTPHRDGSSKSVFDLAGLRSKGLPSPPLVHWRGSSRTLQPHPQHTERPREMEEAPASQASSLSASQKVSPTLGLSGCEMMLFVTPSLSCITQVWSAIPPPSWNARVPPAKHLLIDLDFTPAVEGGAEINVEEDVT